MLPAPTPVTVVPSTVATDISFDVIVYSSSTFVIIKLCVVPFVISTLSGLTVANVTDFNQCACNSIAPVTFVVEVTFVPPTSSVYHPSNI